MNTEKMLMKAVVALFLLSFGTVIAHAQSANSCTYSYSFGSGDNYFAFCLTPYGTLASLQGLAGNLLDPVNPIEGFVICDSSDWDFFGPIKVFPGLGLLGSFAPGVVQPNGTGKLPIMFDYGNFSTTITANQTAKTVVFTTPFIKLWGDDKYESASGPWTRAAGLASANSSFSYSELSAFGYTPPGGSTFGLVMISGSFKGGNIGCQKCISPGEPGISQEYVGGCYAGGSTPFVGQGTIFNVVGFSTQSQGTSVFKYKVF